MVAITAVLGAFAAIAAVLGAAFAAQNNANNAAAAVPNPDCSLTVPANPLSATGLATPYQLSATNGGNGPCNEANANQSAFVQATVINPATGAVSVYNPLVVDKGTRPAAAPVVPALPAGAVVGIWFGFNGTNLTLTGNGARNCVNGSNGSIFGQFAYCNAPGFFRSANAAETSGKLTVPALGTAKDGKPCLTTRDFGLVDQDQSDNVTTAYLANGNGRIAQPTAANTAKLAGATQLLNGSDNLLLDAFVDPALGCTPWTAPDLANPGRNTTSLGMDELQAAKDQAAPVALVPLNDPMVLNNNAQSRTKTNLYRAGVDQTPINNVGGSPTAYCRSLAALGTQRINLDRPFTINAVSPTAGMNLFDFLTARLAASLTNLNCPQAAKPTASATATGTTTATPTATPTGRHHHRGSGDQAPTSTPRTAPRTTQSAAQTATPTATAAVTTAPATTASSTPVVG